MDLQQTGSSFSNNGTTPKTQVNGLDAGSSVGFRHHLPQIAVMARNPKIAQSKTSTKTETANLEKATVHVEGVGKVLRISEEVMEVEDTSLKTRPNGEDIKEAAEKLLESVEMMDTVTETVKTDNDLVSETSERKSSEQANDLVSETSEGKLSGQAASPQHSKPEKGQESVNEHSTVSENERNNNADKVSSPSRMRRKSSLDKPETTEKSPLKKVNIVESVSTELSSEELASPVGKRQRKPKKLDIETEEEAPKIKTPKEKTSKPKVEVTPEVEAKYPVTWLVGDLVWSKVSGHPWWPCMISYDPWLGVYTKVQAHRPREYHVQFFGDAAERAWINSNNLLEFKGKADFDQYVQGLYTKARDNKKEKQRIHKWYGVPASRAKAVNIGIDAAEEAIPLTRNERKAKYTFIYEPPKKKGAASVKSPPKAEKSDSKTPKSDRKSRKSESVNGVVAARKRKLETNTPDSQRSAKRQRVETPKNSVSESKKTPVSRPVVGVEASFDVFCQKEKDSVLEEHPDFDDDQLLDFCRQQWCMMSKKQKARYKSKYSEESELSQQLSPRKRKPSKKILEAEEDNKAVDEVLNKKTESVQPKPTSPRSSPRQATPRTANKTETPKSTTNKLGSKKAALADKSSKQKAEAGDSTKKLKRARNSEMMELQAEVDLIKQSAESVEEEEDETQSRASSGDGVQEQTPAVVVKKEKRRRRPEVKDKDSESGSEKLSQSDDGSRGSPSPVPEVSRRRPSSEKKEEEYEMEIYKLSSSGPQRKENLCQICEQTGDLLECQGPCQGFFHMDCLGLSVNPAAEFKCDECTTGVHSCFVCKKSDSSTQRCSVAVCGKFYHIDCVKQFPQARVEGKSVTCPLHQCHTCLAGNLKSSAKATHGRLLRCIRCPTAYHVGDFCIAAGSINLTGFNIVCARHFQPILTQKHHSHVNVSWCFNCNKGGTLLCCESCPASFHSECLNLPEFPTGSWYCEDCVNGKRPLYGEIVWVKIGNYRWWPGEICHPRNVPLNIQEKAHQVGEFPVHFLGSHEYFWLHQGRVFSYQDGDKGSTRSNSAKGLQKSFNKGLNEASEAYKVWKTFKDNKEQIEIEKNKKKPAPFKLVKNNIPLGNVTIVKADLSEIPRCDCKPDMDKPCSSSSDCLNCMMMYECHPAICAAGEKCQNQRFQKRTYPQQQPYKTESRGWGLLAMEDISKGQFVNEYVGDLIDEVECKKRIIKAHEDDVCNFYMMTLDMNRVIDAGPKGNMSRFMNHSCGPNLETQKWHVNGDVRVGLFALRDIKAGEELTFNYNLDCLGNEKTKCCCGSQNCSGFLGVRPKTQVALLLEKNRKEAKLTKLKKKKKPTIRRKHDDDCFRCGEGGELVMCDRASCTKSYHLSCLGLDKPPYGKWVCPWHHCDNCGKPATHLCVECPNSFCTAHVVGNTRVFDEKTYCLEHNELLETLAESQSQTSASEETSDGSSDIDSQISSKRTARQQVKMEAKLDRQLSDTENNKDKGIKSKSDPQGNLPPKKRAPKLSMDKEVTGDGNPPAKRGRPKKSVDNVGNGNTRGQKGQDLLAVAPMFDDDEDEEFGLVIDIPNF